MLVLLVSLVPLLLSVRRLDFTSILFQVSGFDFERSSYGITFLGSFSLLSFGEVFDTCSYVFYRLRFSPIEVCCSIMVFLLNPSLKLI
jgi:hypothetical protein